MEKSIRQRVREQVEEDLRNMRVPTKVEHDFAVANRNTNKLMEDLCCRIAEAYAQKREAFTSDLRTINDLMQRNKS